ncbi:hypothetical protein JCM8097_009188 [Rhodosporidiobolus ruineniae]
MHHVYGQPSAPPAGLYTQPAHFSEVDPGVVPGQAGTANTLWTSGGGYEDNERAGFVQQTSFAHDQSQHPPQPASRTYPPPEVYDYDPYYARPKQPHPHIYASSSSASPYLPLSGSHSPSPYPPSGSRAPLITADSGVSFDSPYSYEQPATYSSDHHISSSQLAHSRQVSYDYEHHQPQHIQQHIQGAAQGRPPQHHYPSQPLPQPPSERPVLPRLNSTSQLHLRRQSERLEQGLVQGYAPDERLRAASRERLAGVRAQSPFDPRRSRSRPPRPRPTHIDSPLRIETGFEALPARSQPTTPTHPSHHFHPYPSTHSRPSSAHPSPLNSPDHSYPRARPTLVQRTSASSFQELRNRELSGYSQLQHPNGSVTSLSDYAALLQAASDAAALAGPSPATPYEEETGSAFFSKADQNVGEAMEPSVAVYGVEVGAAEPASQPLQPFDPSHPTHFSTSPHFPSPPSQNLDLSSTPLLQQYFDQLCDLPPPPTDTPDFPPTASPPQVGYSQHQAPQLDFLPSAEIYAPDPLAMLAPAPTFTTVEPSLLPPFENRPPSPVPHLQSLSYQSSLPDYTSFDLPLAPAFPPSHSASFGHPPEPDDDETARIVALAAIKRALHLAADPPLSYFPARAKQGAAVGSTGSAAAGGSAAGTSSFNASAASSASSTQRGRDGKAPTMLEHWSSCWTCGIEMALLRLRNKDLSNLVPRSRSTCLACLPVDLPDSRCASDASKDEPTYADTLSAAIDKLEGLGLSGQEDELAEEAGTNAEEIITVPEDEVELPAHLQDHSLRCDVCSHVLGILTMSPSALDESQPIPAFTVETICAKCNRLYKPCSDCGGGGGRLTSGRWRCIELFHGRKTCTLSHARFPPISDISFSVSSVSHITPQQMDAYEPVLRRVYFNARLDIIARPQHLSKQDGLASSYREASKSTADTWGLISTLLRQSSDPLDGMQRYLNLTLARPRGRRAASAANGKKGKEPEVIGWGIAEADFARQALFIAAVVPWSTTGPAYDANSSWGKETTKYAKEERNRINSAREAAGLEPFPPLKYNWLIAPFKKSSRMSQNLERRGYIHLDDLVRKYPKTDLTAFPPIRSCWVPKPCTLSPSSTRLLLLSLNLIRADVNAWAVWVRVLEDEADLGGPPVKAGKKRGAGRAEVRAKA